MKCIFTPIRSFDLSRLRSLFTHPHPGFRAVLFAIALFTASAVFADEPEEVCGVCDKKVVVTGDFQHASRDSVTITNAGAREAAYREDIRGTNFTLTVPNLDAGKYTIEIGLAELSFDEAGARIFDIVCGDQVIASNLDIFAAAGGMDKAWQLRATVEHPGDAVGGPLSIHFIARENNAKLNTFELRNESGTTLVSMKAGDLAPQIDSTATNIPVVAGPVLWKDATLPMETRVKDLISRMSLAEKAAQMDNGAPAIPRLGLPAYNYWSECLHGVARAGTATVFPQAIGLAAMWDAPLLHDIADTIATEARAKNNDWMAAHDGNSAQYRGLTFWTPNINIFRDPRWGRGQETYGEDPFLTSRLAVSFIQGLQGDDPKYIKAMACAKHFAVHSGPEPERHRFDAQPPERDFYETYLPHFEAAVREGHVGAVMGAYNSVYGEPACANDLLLVKLLRGEWGFEGHVVSDCGAINDIFSNHKYVATDEEAAARGVDAGCDLCCGQDYRMLAKAVHLGLITEKQMDVSLARVLEARFKLGMFDPPDQVPYTKISIQENDTAEHAALALKAARESVVLLKNDGLLPLNRARIKRIAVIGANADSVPVLQGNYNGTASKPITLLAGIRAVAGPGIEVEYVSGGPLAERRATTNGSPAGGGVQPGPVLNAEEALTDALRVALNADVVIYVGGLTPQLEGEEMRVNYVGFAGGDRTDIALPRPQQLLIKALYATGKPVIFVNTSGSAVAMVWEASHLPAIVQAWYPGEEGGQAVAEVLFGDVNPAGRLPITFYRSTNDLPDFEDYSMANRTYRYFTGSPLFAFGHGLSYTKFDFQGAKLDHAEATRKDTVKVTLTVANTGTRDGDEVVQVYYRHLKSSQPQARMALCAFKRVNVPVSKSVPVTLEIPIEQLRYWDTVGKKYVVEPGPYEIMIGPASDEIHQRLQINVREEAAHS